MQRYRIWIRSSTHRAIPQYRDIQSPSEEVAAAHARRWVNTVDARELRPRTYDLWELHELNARGRAVRLVSEGSAYA